MTETTVLECSELTMRRGADFRVRLPALRVAPGGASALLGSSGCGKTTLLLGILGLAEGAAAEGAVRFAGEPLPEPGSRPWRRLLFEDVALVLQDARASLDPVQRLGAQMREATAAGDVGCAEALEQLGIEDAAALLRRYPHQVSGGQAQRVLLAIALLRRPRLLVADEPAASLDRPRRDDLVRLLATLRERTGTALLVSTHDHELVHDLAAEAWVHRDGAFVPGRPEQPPWPPLAERPRGGGTVLSCHGVGVRKGRRWILREASFGVERGEVLALVGPSGAGKTTLALVLAGHLRPDAGRVWRPARRTAVQLLFQDAYASLTPHRTVRDLVAETAAPGFDVDAEARGLELAPGHLDRLPGSLSGGERRRAALLRALSVFPEVMILDEPTASLDRATAVPVLETLLGVRRRGAVTFVLITHDVGLAEAVAHRVVRVEDGRVLVS